MILGVGMAVFLRAANNNDMEFYFISGFNCHNGHKLSRAKQCNVRNRCWADKVCWVYFDRTLIIVNEVFAR